MFREVPVAYSVVSQYSSTLRMYADYKLINVGQFDLVLFTTDNKNSEESKAELRSMVYNEVCNPTESQEEAPPTMVPIPTHMTNAAAASEQSVAAMDIPQSDTVTLQVTQQTVDDPNAHWSVEQVQY